MRWNVFLDIVTSEVFCTVISGVFVFVISQLLLELVIKPRVEYRKTISKIVYSLSYYADVISNPLKVSQEKKKEDFDYFNNSKYSLASDELRKLGCEIRTFSFKKKINKHISEELILLSNSLWEYQNSAISKEDRNSTHLHDLQEFLSNKNKRKNKK